PVRVQQGSARVRQGSARVRQGLLGFDKSQPATEISWAEPAPVGRLGYSPPMRALLVVNPKATTTSERSRNVLVRALRTEMDIRFGETRRRGHAAELARQAVRDRLDVVVALGGDGTVNEAANGMRAATPRIAKGRARGAATAPPPAA